jgi:uncharacterized protein with FMN-binding domain
VRRVILALLGTAASTTLLVGAKGPVGVAHSIVAGAPHDQAAAAGGGDTGEDAGPSSSARPVSASATATARPGASGSARPATLTSSATAGGLPAGTYVVTGPVVTHKYGPVQVRISVSGGRIVDIVALQTPTSHSESVQINNKAVPKLRQEALTAQTANIATVSGATLTSNAYRSSLQGALDAAARGVRS